MSRKNSIETILDMFLLNKFFPLIITVVLIISGLFIWGYFKFAKPVYDEAKSLGYGQSETVWYDSMSGNPIPKKEYYNKTYNNDNLYITKGDGTKVYFKQIKELRDEGNNYMHYLAGIKKEDINKLKKILDVLCCDYLEVNYEINSETNGRK